MKESTGPNIVFVSSFLKNECGIASYTQDLISSIKQNNSAAKVSVIAIGSEERKAIPKSKFIQFTIQPDLKPSYISASELINTSEASVVHIQHEFGLYGDNDGENILELIKRSHKPVVITFHTVLRSPSPRQRFIVEEILKLASKVIVMAQSAKDNLVENYDVQVQDNILIIPHGVPKISQSHNNSIKSTLGLEGKFVISTFGLLNPGKGIEYVIKAMKSIADQSALFLVLGKTHPKILKKEGEKYRNYLKQEIAKNQLEDRVSFVDRYLSIKSLISYLKATDIYITPYLEPQQATSGTLAYAMGAGKICISTPYIYANEVLDQNRGIIVPFRDADAIAGSINKLIGDPVQQKNFKNSAYLYSRSMLWENVGLKHLDVYDFFEN